MTSVCLCMIVRDEAAVIERCLTSVRPLIDRWVICDTGSRDETRALIDAALEDVPGELHERPWVDFGHNRTELMALAQGKAAYLLLIDADMTVTFDVTRLSGLSADSYMLRHDEDPEYWIKRLVRGDRRWRYIGATHEYITTDGPERSERLDAIVIHHHGDSGTRPGKFERDLRLLSREHERNPDDPRTAFYLAQTLRDLGRLDDAVDFYQRRAEMEGWEEEVFYSLYQMGALSARLGRRAQAVDALLRAWNRAPERAEPLRVLAALYREGAEHHAAHLVAERGLSISIPVEGLFVERWVYEWGLLFEYSIAAYWIGQARAALQACDRLLALPQLPEAHRRQTIANRTYCVRALPSLPAITSSLAYRRPAPSPGRAATRATANRANNVTVVQGGHRLVHRGTAADHAVVQRIFTERAYALDRLAAWPGLERYANPHALGGIPLIVDLGAHFGAASVWFALHHPEAQVIALEPDAADFSRLRANCAVLPRITPQQRAIAGRPGQMHREVSIDRVVEEAPGTVPFILKVDLEGGEESLFATHWQILARFALVIVELHDTLLPGAGTSRAFLRWHVAHNRDLVADGGDLFSLAAGLTTV
ncbi:MAG: glycosyltransferase [Solirubrobacterales bacterium]|nr:glycosyltransferase [Solirubrobacterales bacterium]